LPRKTIRPHRPKRPPKPERAYRTLLAEQRQQLDALRQTLKTEMTNATRQLEAYVNLVHMLSGHSPLPSMHGWPVSPDLAVLLLQQLQGAPYDLVLEFGSGSSTVLLAQYLQQQGQGCDALPRARQLAFEHLEAFQAQTLSQLHQRGLAASVALFCAPLVPYVGANGTTYPYYDCVAALSAAALAVNALHPRVLVLVDGPPSATGLHARYPALPLLLQAFPAAQLDVWLDDYIRRDEQEIAEMWQQELRLLGRRFSCQVHRLEKDAFHLRIEPIEESADNAP
jgi:hypothetical protein